MENISLFGITVLDGSALENAFSLESQYKLYGKMEPALEETVQAERKSIWESIKSGCKKIVSAITKAIQNFIMRLTFLTKQITRKFDKYDLFWIPDDLIENLEAHLLNSERTTRKANQKISNLSDIADSIEIDGETIDIDQEEHPADDVDNEIFSEIKIVYLEINQLVIDTLARYNKLDTECKNNHFSPMEIFKYYSDNNMTKIDLISLKKIGKFISVLGSGHGNSIIQSTNAFSNHSLSAGDQAVNTDSSYQIVGRGKRIVKTLKKVSNYVNRFTTMITGPAKIIKCILEHKVTINI